MIAYDISVRIIFLSQTAFGTLGNSFILGFYIITSLRGLRLRPTDFFLTQLSLANDVVLLSKGIPQTMATFGLNNFLDDAGCKLFFYIHRVARGLSLSTTCLLSGFQAITISPMSSGWAELKTRVPKCIIPSCLLCWILNLLTNCIILVYMKAPVRGGNTTKIQDFVFCSFLIHPTDITSLYILMISIPDVVCFGIMIWASSSMVFVLYRHHQRVQHIYSTRLSPRGSPVVRATQTILMLVIMFVSFYSLNSMLVLHMIFVKSHLWLVNSSALLSACFPALSPFVLIISDSRVPKSFLALWSRVISLKILIPFFKPSSNWIIEPLSIRVLTHTPQLPSKLSTHTHRH
ncbi:vomeronasal 1 receptor monDomV1R1248 [Monodelphis domestica]|uniref:vomeronasal 1 receptor monDomV1R1248 n=1 Tax=Monodelphis domestica TaxID=13616 RepID=UPI0001C4794D|nr:vomeronasal 1 receptor monDomV1R1248 [Monodelphis domestica]